VTPEGPAVPASAALFEITGLAKRLGGVGGFELRVPRLVIAQGAFVALTGKSGSGKSTLLDLLSLITRPNSSQSFRFNPRGRSYDLTASWRDSADDALAGLRRRFMGYVLQNGGLCSFLNVADNIALPMRMNGANRRRMEASIKEGLSRFGMERHHRRDVRTLSGGERQRVAILRALAHQPAVVFADEPTAALDFDTAHQVLAALRDAAKAAGTTIIMVTHDVELVEPFADQRIIFRRISDDAADRVYVAEDVALTAPMAAQG
jgi:putative ABC transport system ATP-binding protein